ncbi:hypothetical protein LX16_2178 [Stackebrandtia albiflava]|uniref:Uncharacterized protein n=1 Tax=Stackebrandtia albiflava TaxID=406432 RepID=A0A562V0Y0_9ACTN|nr:hypothetical protein [Stackebrandtia albiflava]TWJ11457.1 hypothetical protein LX16_2178 [Stackebrandtia albiflava]
MTAPRRPATLTAAVYLLALECFVFAVLIAVFVYRTLNEVDGYAVYFGDTEAERGAALTEAVVIGGLLVIAVILLVGMAPPLMRGEPWARTGLVAVAAGLVVYPLFLTVRALGDPLYIDWMKIGFTLAGTAGAAVAIGLLTAPVTSRYIRAVNGR